MNAYKTVELGSACELVMGQSPSSDTYNSDGIGLPFFQGNADFGEEHPTPSTWCSEPKKTARKGDILISVRAPIGAVNTATEECCIGRGVAALRPDKNLLNAAFLKYHLIAKRPELERAGTGSTFTAVGKKALSKLEVRLFSLGDQIEMSRRLDILSENIHTAREQLTMLDYLVKSRFVEMFECIDLPLKPFSELVTSMHIGPFGSSLTNDAFCPAEEADCVVYEQKHAIHQSIGLGFRYIDYEKHAELSRFTVGPGSILVSCRGTIGKVYQLPDNAPVGVIHPSLMKIEVDYSSANGTYVVDLLRSVFAREESRAVGSGVKMAIRAKELSAMIVPVPPLDMQQNYARFVSQVNKLRFDVQRQIEKLEMLKKSLMQEYFG